MVKKFTQNFIQRKMCSSKLSKALLIKIISKLLQIFRYEILCEFFNHFLTKKNNNQKWKKYKNKNEQSHTIFRFFSLLFIVFFNSVLSLITFSLILILKFKTNLENRKFFWKSQKIRSNCENHKIISWKFQIISKIWHNFIQNLKFLYNILQIS